MSYILKYTTTDDIRRRLRGRLEVQGGGLYKGAAAAIVDNELIEQIGQQIETMVELGLGQIYKLPIPYTATYAMQLIKSIVEKLIISEIAVTHFQQLQSAELGADQGFGAVLKKQAVEQLEMIMHGHGVYIPGIMNPPQENPSTGMFRQPIVLPGLTLLTSEEQPDIYSRNYSYVERRELSEDEQLWA